MVATTPATAIETITDVSDGARVHAEMRDLA
jgi:hypothetical protein